MFEINIGGSLVFQIIVRIWVVWVGMEENCRGELVPQESESQAVVGGGGGEGGRGGGGEGGGGGWQPLGCE